MSTTDNIKSMLKSLNMNYTIERFDQLIKLGIEKSLSYEKFLENMLKEEMLGREKKKIENRMKQAAFPEYKEIDAFNLTEQQSLSSQQLNQLSELTWLDQGYNIILLGPPGVGNYRKYLIIERNEAVIHMNQ